MRGAEGNAVGVAPDRHEMHVRTGSRGGVGDIHDVDHRADAGGVAVDVDARRRGGVEGRDRGARHAQRAGDEQAVACLVEHQVARIAEHGNAVIRRPGQRRDLARRHRRTRARRVGELVDLVREAARDPDVAGVGRCPEVGRRGLRGRGDERVRVDRRERVVELAVGDREHGLTVGRDGDSVRAAARVDLLAGRRQAPVVGSAVARDDHRRDRRRFQRRGARGGNATDRDSDHGDVPTCPHPDLPPHPDIPPCSPDLLYPAGRLR